MSYQLSLITYQLSLISYHLSAITYQLSSRLGVSLAYGRDDIKSLSGVCIILTSRIGQRSERRVNENENENENE